MQPTHVSPVDTLYFAPGAASMLVHWLLLELEIPHALQRVDTAAGEQKRPSYLALNPNGVVPTWVRDGKPMGEAAAIAMTLADQHPAKHLAPAAGDPLQASSVDVPSGQCPTAIVPVVVVSAGSGGR
jgi:glutathione S-transferase